MDVVDDPAEFLRLGAFIKSLLIGHPKDLDIVRGELTPIVAEHGRLVRTRHDYLEIIPVAASKGAALGRLAAHLGVPLERVVAVGDQENDVGDAARGRARRRHAARAGGGAPGRRPRRARRRRGRAARGCFGELFPDHFA